ncbi:hypothetical protein RM550_29560 [Streptomyces sp. DSM 41527]|uniref:DUF308 domain-containing protein n=1 Tax=Streptomyces mooreae TaxID=3075523 RepID=A0ABU2TFX6_9ACTN|nr:hypothetical protein [Streptomyces sp. DSM 41527]MDT0459819.1 hypothetical protein [Streptomyces sp. DSM 41527]
MAERSPRDPRDPLDEEAAWAQIVAGYGDQPSFPPEDGDDGTDEPAGNGGTNTKRAEETPASDAGESAAEDAGKGPAAGSGEDSGKDGSGKDEPGDGRGDAPRPGSFVVFAPGVGPRTWSPSEPSDDDFDETDEGHFTPPEPPPLPQADVTAKFAWIAVIGGPLLLVAMVLLQQPVTWWITVLGIGGFLGGFATLVARMKNDDEDDNDLPGSGAVV